MTKRRRDQFERQTVVDAQTIEALTGATEVPPQGIVQTLVEQQLGNERERDRKRPKRPTEVRRRRRRLGLTFSVDHKNVVAQLRDLAYQWELYTNSGAPAISQVVEYLLLPQLKKAVAGEIAAPPRNRDDESEETTDGVQWF